MPDKKRKSGSIAEADVEETTTDASNEAENQDEQDGGTANQGGRRLPHVDAEQFAAIRDELGMSNKEVAEAIGRTVARVSELTYSQGASVQTFERFEQDVRAWREAHPKVEAAEESASPTAQTDGDSDDNDEDEDA